MVIVRSISLASAALCFSILAAPTFASDHVSLGCTPIPAAGGKVDRNPTTRINVDLDFGDGQGTPGFAVLHMLANGGQADRWAQYQFVSFKYYPAEADKSARFSYFGSLRVNPRQKILMTLSVPSAGSNVWFYQERVGYQDPTFSMPARCYEEALHGRPGS
jgi:hypothetical protein